MDGTFVGLYLLAIFLGALSSGLSGFAMGVILLGIWAHFLPPVQTAILIVGYSVFTQGYGIWKLRHALQWRRVAPFIAGGVAGVPAGAALLTWVDATYLRPAVGVLLVLYGLWGLAKPSIKPLNPGIGADVGIGVLNGVLAGLTGLVGIIAIIWCQLRGWPKDEQRAVYQPVMFAAGILGIVSLGAAGAITAETLELYLLGLPVLLAGLWSGFKLYGILDDAAFRKVLLASVLLSGIALILSALR
jgi:uncharacterized protein